MIIVSMKPVPVKATAEQRRRMFFDYCQESQQANPHLVLPLGVKKRWWQFFKVEHPFTTRYK